MATRVRLEIDQIQILRKKKRWKLYFLVVADHPTEDGKKVIGVVPSRPMKVDAKDNNLLIFDTSEPGAEGLYILSRELPKDREVNVHIYLFHSRRSLNKFGEILGDIEKGLGNEALGIAKTLIGAAGVPWLEVAAKAIKLIGKVITEIPDRDMGFVSAFERFGPEFEITGEIDREKEFSSRDASIVYSWSVEQDS